MKYVTYRWRVVMGLVYLGIVIGILSVAATRFETVVLAGMVELYAVVFYNFSLIGVATDSNNYAGLVRFRVLATAQGVTAALINNPALSRSRVSFLAVINNLRHRGPRIAGRHVYPCNLGSISSRAKLAGSRCYFG